VEALPQVPANDSSAELTGTIRVYMERVWGTTPVEALAFAGQRFPIVTSVALNSGRLEENA